MSHKDAAETPAVMNVRELGMDALQVLLGEYGLHCKKVADRCDIPGSFWGESEAGLVGTQLLLRDDTPVHSALHEACHFICMTPDRREGLHTDA
ncbi:hypothetical protein MNBD_GAMMA14-2469, partial [hydrothermal vent metagenome]